MVARYHGWLLGTDATINTAVFNKAGASATEVDALYTDNCDTATQLNMIMSEALVFKPSNLFDSKDIKIGDRIKISYASTTAPDAEAAFVYNNGGGYNAAKGYDVDSTDSTKNGRESSYLFVVGVGLDVHHYYESTTRISTRGGRVVMGHLSQAIVRINLHR